jgi:hypothetical protein
MGVYRVVSKLGVCRVLFIGVRLTHLKYELPLRFMNVTEEIKH